MEHAMSSKQGVALAFKAVATLLASLWAATSHATTELYYVHTDHLGTPQVMTDKNQEVVWKRSQTPFGETVEDSGTVEQPLRFPGQYADLEMGLNYNYYRDYDPSLGRYVQSDPIGLRGGINTYGYAYQNPLRYVDPDGLTPGTGAGCLAGAWAGPLGCGAGAAVGTLLNLGVGALVGYNIYHNDDAPDGSECPVPGATPGNKTRGPSEIWDKEDGDFGTANNDFDNLGPDDVQELPNGGRVGQLPDGRKVVVRPSSKDGKPTLEIQDGRSRVKVRYGR